jgi:hypothetical protein
MNLQRVLIWLCSAELLEHLYNCEYVAAVVRTPEMQQQSIDQKLVNMCSKHICCAVSLLCVLAACCRTPT